MFYPIQRLSKDTRIYTKSFYDQMSMLWVPYIIFKNTDSDEAVTVGGDIRTIVAVTREGEFVRSGPEVVDEVSLYLYIY